MKKKVMAFAVTLSLLLSGMLVAIGGEVEDGGEEIKEQIQEIEDWHDLDAIRDHLDGDNVLMNDLDEETDGYDELASAEANKEDEFDESLGSYDGNDAGDQFEVTYTPLDHIITSEDDDDGSEVEVEIIDADEGTIELKEDTEGNLYIEYKTIEEIGLGWEPIEDFSGTFDGQGYSISDLYINRPEEDFNGLFGDTEENSKIKNLGLTNTNITGNWFTGTITGRNEGTITQTHSNGTTTGTINNSHTGGLTGRNTGTINNTHTQTTVNGNDNTGGLTGTNTGQIQNSYSTGKVTGEDETGGLVGKNTGQIQNTYTTGQVTGEDETGGLVGRNSEDATIKKSYANQNTTNTEKFISEQKGTVEDSGFRTTTEMTEEPYDEDTYIDWDFENTWLEHTDIVQDHQGNTGYPALQWQVDEIQSIYDWHDLDAIRDDLSGIYPLVNDLDENTSGYDELVDTEEGWEPIEDFNGKFDGQGNTIKDLYINRPDENEIGLFAENDGTITNLGIKNANITGDWRVAAIIGRNYKEGEITNSYTDKNTIITSDATRIGGIAGRNTGTIKNTHSHATINGNNRAGGLVGYNHGGTITNSYSTGLVTGDDGKVGGLVGENADGSVEDSYWDIETSGQSNSEGGTGLTTDEMTGDDAEINMEGFDFENIWNTVSDDYPALQCPEGYILKIEEPVGEGTVRVDGVEVTDWPYEEVYDRYAEVELKAEPEEYWHFDKWMGDYTGTEEEITIMMDRDTEMTAVFEGPYFEAQLGSSRAALYFDEYVSDSEGEAITEDNLVFDDKGTGLEIQEVSHVIDHHTAVIEFNRQVTIDDLWDPVVQPKSGEITNEEGNEIDEWAIEMTDYEDAISLKEGWNLVSIPERLHEDYNIEDALQEQNLPVRSTWTYQDGWNSDLSDVDTLDAFFIDVYRPAELEIEFAEPHPTNVPPSRELEEGWNLVGTQMDPYEEINVTIPEYLVTVDGSWGTIYSPGYNLESWTHTAVEENLSDVNVNAYEAYWIFMTEEGTLAGRSARDEEYESDFEVDITEVDDEVVEGETVEVSAEILNTGRAVDTQGIELRNSEDEVIDTYKGLKLGAEEEEKITLRWETEIGDSGERQLKVVSEDDYAETLVTVLEKNELTINIEGEGAVEVDGVKVEDGWTNDYVEGTLVDLEAIPDDEWFFYNWDGDLTGTDPQVNITMDEDKSIKATFNQTYEVSDWHDLDKIRDYRDINFVLMDDLDENTDGYDEYNTEPEDYEVEEDAGSEETWDDGDTIDIPLDEEDYESISVEDEDGNPISYTVEHPTITIEEDTGEKYVYVTYENAVVGWEPIGNSDNPFNGTFDGNGHEISDLYINRPETREVGLFGRTNNGAEVIDTALVDANIGGDSCVGGLVGWNYGTVSDSFATADVSGESWGVGGLVGFNPYSSVSNSYATGNVCGDRYVGGLVGVQLDSSVSNSYATGNVSGGEDIGGLVGYSSGPINKSYATGNVSGGEDIGGLVGYSSGPINKSYATGNVSGDSRNVGGLVGHNRRGTVENSYATGNVSGGENVGGLVGSNDYGTVSNSYAIGLVNGENDIGGLVGRNREIVSNSYSTGNVSGDDEVGGLVGSNDGDVSTSFYHEDNPRCDVEGYGSLPLSYDEFGSISTFESVGWNIEMVETDRDKPFLSWEKGEANSTWHIKETEQTHDLTIDIEGEGDTEPPEGTHTYYEHGKIVIEAIPDEDWYFKEWTGDYEGAEEKINITMDSERQITAHFVEYPREINDWYELDDFVRNDLDGGYSLMKDLDEDTEGYDELVDRDKGWDPIGSEESPFTGSFDGNGHEISDLYINHPGTSNVGLFGYIENGEYNPLVENVSLVDINVTGDRYVGGLIGYNGGSSEIRNSSSTGNVTGDRYVGGLIGYNGGSSEIRNSSSTGNVTGELYLGGLIGYNENGVITNSSSNSDVTGSGLVGGLAGINEGTIKQTYSDGTVIADFSQIGGLVGRNDGLVTNTYTHTTVNGDKRTGGLVGLNSDGNIENSYSTGTVTGEENETGGLIGDNEGNVSNSYWDIETSGITEEECASGAGDGLTTDEMTGDDAEINMEGFDFEKVWNTVSDDYPELQWKEEEVIMEIEPEDGATDVELGPDMGTNLSVKLNHPEDKDMDVTFYGNESGEPLEMIGENTSVASRDYANITWDGLEEGTEYEWYVEVKDDEGTIYVSQVWTFTTISE